MVGLDEQFIARDAAMLATLELAQRVASSEATVLVQGETGTGKERLARLVHDGSPRSDGPFLPVNCGALTESLLESELFGHVRGAFSGATADREGLFSAAAGGTLFLDEISETSPAMQVKLLRAIQERTVRPVGDNREIPIDIRIVAASNRDLSALAREGAFRRDLFYRVRVVELLIPPLRERPDDIPALAQHFAAKYCDASRCDHGAVLDDSFLQFLTGYAWPGNVRELENAIERVVVLARGRGVVSTDDLPPEILGRTAPVVTGEPADVLPLRLVERQHILAAVDAFAGNRREAAHALGISETTLWRKLREYNGEAQSSAS